ncbi:nitrogen fixation protein NifQ [Candidatus Methylospira mobilis]|uniref:Nitrogen fixation protein NifQ n=1 Tax=Candidatus Methylospira mobilis TaxID=1808979 RepID=A0A5Q0BGY4_9GAMM|nr:nitrogen fixation protein NifQ [Candidatus Methylospira mobilis]QFY41471.1 nitrogen fixation protein NifQ [Candidatus Methylospira mobilis]WNV05303.1 nitrogen fixation protein NifQ [Candidatus Methylospira mobilis]
MQVQGFIKHSIKAAAAQNASLQPRAQAYQTGAPFAVAVPHKQTAEQIYQSLARHAHSASPNAEWVARILSSWHAGRGALPDYLGLLPEEFQALQKHLYGRALLSGISTVGREPDFSRMLERDDLKRLMMQSSAYPGRAETAWMAGILIAGCLGSDHLWQDLGLWNRSDLSGLVRYNFPELAAKNTRDMKWKKFIYKQLCEAEGVYVCRAPSCDVCIDHAGCFGPEE